MKFVARLIDQRSNAEAEPARMITPKSFSRISVAKPATKPAKMRAAKRDPLVHRGRDRVTLNPQRNTRRDVFARIR